MGLQKQDTSSTLGLEAAANGTPSPPSSPSSRRGSASGPTLSRAALLQLQRDAATARKQLLANFANYDALARRIRDLPDGGNNSLKRIKDGVDRKAAAFLQMNVSCHDKACQIRPMILQIRLLTFCFSLLPCCFADPRCSLFSLFRSSMPHLRRPRPLQPRRKDRVPAGPPHRRLRERSPSHQPSKISSSCCKSNIRRLRPS